jgi:hypothetical protein
MRNTFSDELAVDFWGIVFLFWKHDHPFPHILPSHTLQRKGRRLTSRCSWNRNAFSLDGSNIGGSELTKGIRSDEYSVTRVDDSAFHNSRHHRTNERDGESIIDVELERSVSVVVSVMRKDVQELSYKVQRLASDVGDLEYRTYSLRDELSSGVDALVVGLDKDRYFPRTRRF